MCGPRLVYPTHLVNDSGWFPALDTVNKPAVNLGVKCPFESLLSILLGDYPEVELLGHRMTPVLIF